VRWALVGALVTLRPAQTNIGYDLQGNRTSVQPLTGTASTLGYDQANRLTSVGGTASYTYNGDGLRASKAVSGVSTAQTWDTSSTVANLLMDVPPPTSMGPR
jgi:YD repeat-containing protein